MIDQSKVVDQLRATLGKMEITLGSIDDAIAWMDETGTVQWCNGAFDVLVRRKHLEALGADLVTLLPLEKNGRALPPASHPAKRALQTRLGAIDKCEYRQDEARLALEIYSICVEMGGQGATIVLAIRDITAQSKVEAALRDAKERTEAANRELEAFSYSVAHDLRAPLRKIDGYSQALLEDYAGKLDAGGKEFLNRLRASSQSMARLIDDLLELSRVTLAEMRRERVDLSAMVKSLAAELQAEQPRRKVEFIIAPGVTATGDSRFLRNILKNLLENAWKFTSKLAAARIEFGVIPGRRSPAYFVRDDGAGFDQAFAGKLFTPFSRLHSQAEFRGTGIGLAAAQRMVARHGGRIWAEGTPGRGAIFYFELRA